jgi:glutathione peroxidase
MRKFFILAAILKIGFASGQTGSIYSFQIDSLTSGHAIDFSAFQGKKILLINAASGDSANWQYAQIKQLYRQYKDSLVIVVLPSNSFNTENMDEATMLNFYSQETTNKFPVTKKIAVKGNDIDPLYQWLTQKTKNGVMDSEVKRPFQKYLISKSGKLIGVFSARIKPLDPPLIQAITNSSN